MDEREITTLIKSLSRPHPCGGIVIERAAILAVGADSPQIIEWIVNHSGKPEAPVAHDRGLHGFRSDADANRIPAHPTRFVLPAGTLH